MTTPVDLNNFSSTVNDYLLLLVYLIPVALIWFGRVYLRRKASERHAAVLRENQEAGLTEPASLHPLIDRDLCIACNACAKACPENDVLAIIHDKVELINPTKCIGHGACASACPVNAITLVFGSEKRGLDIPTVDPNFETNMPGIFIAGELGGMGLIRNAIEQGRQAMVNIKKKADAIKGNDYDVVIIGAGPAGFSASLVALENKMRYVTLEQESLGGTVSHYPRGKIVMTAPVQLAIVGKVRFRETTKETLLTFWQNVEKDTGVKINYGERMESITPKGKGYEVKTPKGIYQTSTVLLSIGRRGTPRKLNVPGEEQNKVMYRLVDPSQYKGQHVLVVGGGDSALEAAHTIADEPGATVTLSYRSGAFSRAKAKNRDKVERYNAEGKLKVLMNSNVKEVQSDKVILDQNGQIIILPNDAVIVSAGGIVPTGLLKSIGISVETKYGTE
jgi:thioredoxin reductase/Pyruvate/2-oxoacid:ferredoxin oxidoreductase delta subunit